MSLKSLALGIATATVLTGSASAAYLPGLTNLDFKQYTGTFDTGPKKGYFTSVNPTGWTGGSGLIFIGKAGGADDGSYLPVYGPFPGYNPGGGNFVEADGNPNFESGFNYMVHGLTPGTTYQLSFYQAAGQQTGFANGLPTTNQWTVSLGTQGLSLAGGGPVDPTYGPTDVYFNSDPNASVVASPLQTTPSGGVTPWNYVTLNLTADAPDQLLSFLAWGDNGSTINLPPIIFLTGVNSPAGLVPEPGSLALIGLGVAGVAFSARRRARA